MTDTAMVPRKNGGPPEGSGPLIDEQLADHLLGKAQTEGVELLGPDGLLSQITRAVLERALAEEMTDHLGYEKHDPAGRGSGNSVPRRLGGCRRGTSPPPCPAVTQGPSRRAAKAAGECRLYADPWRCRRNPAAAMPRIVAVYPKDRRETGGSRGHRGIPKIDPCRTAFPG